MIEMIRSLSLIAAILWAWPAYAQGDNYCATSAACASLPPGVVGNAIVSTIDAGAMGDRNTLLGINGDFGDRADVHDAIALGNAVTCDRSHTFCVGGTSGGIDRAIFGSGRLSLFQQGVTFTLTTTGMQPGMFPDLNGWTLRLGPGPGVGRGQPGSIRLATPAVVADPYGAQPLVDRWTISAGGDLISLSDGTLVDPNVAAQTSDPKRCGQLYNLGGVVHVSRSTCR